MVFLDEWFKPIERSTSEISGSEVDFVVVGFYLAMVDPEVQFQLG